MKLSDYAKLKGVSYRYHLIVVEHKDRLTRVGFNYLKVLLNKQGKDIEVVNLALEKKQQISCQILSQLLPVFVPEFMD